MAMTDVLASFYHWGAPLLAQATDTEDTGGGGMFDFAWYQWVGILVVVGLIALMMILRNRQQ